MGGQRPRGSRDPVPRALAGFDAVIFDLDGVVTRTARVHRTAWKELFDAFLEEREGEGFEPFTDEDYLRYVDGKPRTQGVASFLSSRGIELPHGTVDDPPDARTVAGLGNRKNAIFRRRLEEDGVEVFGSTVELIEILRGHGVPTAVVSSSKNCRKVLEVAGLETLFEIRVDGVVSEELGLSGKPDPDIFVEAARRLDVEPERAVVIEDALAGVEAGRRGGFGLVVGIDRAGWGDDLKNAGADIVVRDLGELDDGTDDR